MITLFTSGEQAATLLSRAFLLTVLHTIHYSLPSPATACPENVKYPAEIKWYILCWYKHGGFNTITYLV
ncbi:hypothetical protein LZZ85_04165 [Terrimonas sp. NA20]|uniref:Secreted protein n=1 Tax=Terrimonas ginsenosidimutans TaxID=2908004 RepID=A0ABS9KMB0_9BACT|nr:hypothetical protein [Terrimonas ginsenosidimutans]MCG2613458.1 hypothetical protein [Terrimonas ginsenosidimutans]